MTPIRLLAFALPTALLIATGPVAAQENRLLPFWGQPYPAGYTRFEVGTLPRRAHCRVLRRIHTRHGPRTVMEDRCRPVLHARD